MEPGIQLMLRIERQAEAQRRPSILFRDNLEKPSRPLERDNLIQRIFNLPRHQQPCSQHQCEGI
jgi:hypothetical protein